MWRSPSLAPGSFTGGHVVYNISRDCSFCGPATEPGSCRLPNIRGQCNGIGKDGAQRRRFVVGDAVDDAAEVVCSHSGCGEVACDIGGVVAVAVMAVGCEVESADHGVQWCAKVMEQSGCGGCDATVCGCGRLRRGLHRSECYRRQQEPLCKKLL